MIRSWRMAKIFNRDRKAEKRENMYGLVNKAIQDMVIKDHGEEVWHGIRKEAGLEDDRIISLKSYPDSLTFRLVGAACHQLGAEASDILEAFGEHWCSILLRRGMETCSILLGLHCQNS